jgi:hypothetical protein
LHTCKKIHIMSKRSIQVEAVFCPIKKSYRLFYPSVRNSQQETGALTTSIRLAAPKNTHFSLWFGSTYLGQSTDGYVMKMNHTAFEGENKDIGEACRSIRISQSSADPDYVANLKKGVGFELRMFDDIRIKLLDAKGSPDESDTGNITVLIEEMFFDKK